MTVKWIVCLAISETEGPRCSTECDASCDLVFVLRDMKCILSYCIQVYFTTLQF